MFRKNKQNAKTFKCTFGVYGTEYLESTPKSNEVVLNAHNTSVIESCENPQSKRDVQSFLGLINNYRRFIRDCAQIAKQLTELDRSVPFI